MRKGSWGKLRTLVLLCVAGMMVAGCSAGESGADGSDKNGGISEEEAGVEAENTDSPSNSGLAIEDNSKPAASQQSAGNKGAAVMSPKFSEPRLLKHAIPEQAAAALVGANEEYLLFKTTLDGQIYAYQLDSDSIKGIDHNASYAYLAHDNVVLYVIEDNSFSHKQVVYKAIDELAVFGELSSLINVDDLTIGYKDGFAYITYYDVTNPEEGYFTESFAVEHRSYRPPSLNQFYFVDDTAPVFGSYKGEPITYNAGRSSIGQFKYGEPATLQVAKTHYEVDPGKIVALDMNDQGSHLMLVQSEDVEEPVEFYIDGKKVEKFEEPMNAEWLDDQNVLVEDFGVIYLYDTKKKEKQKIAEGVEMNIVNDRLYYRMLDAAYEIEIMKNQ